MDHGKAQILCQENSTRKHHFFAGGLPHNPKGLEVFRDVQWKVEIQQNETRRNLTIGDSAQADLFSSIYSAELHQQIDGIGCQKYKDAAEAIILDFLKEQN